MNVWAPRLEVVSYFNGFPTRFHFVVIKENPRLNNKQKLVETCEN